MFSTIRSINEPRRICLICIFLLGMTALAACGGNGNDDRNSATIISPPDGAVYTYGDPISFTGSGTDDDEEELTGESLVWTSDIDDELGAGAAFTLEELSWGDHAITLIATDSNGKTASDTIYVSVKAWDYPVDLADNINPYGENALDVRAAMDDNGDTIIVWSQSDGSNSQIFMSEYRDGVWTHPTGLSDNISPDGQDAGNPAVAMDNNGNAVIVWHQSDGSYNQIFMSEYRSGAWTHPTDLSDNFSPKGQDAQYQQVAMDDNGNAVITWQQSDGSYTQIFKSEYRNGTWTLPADLSDNISPDNYHTYSPGLAMDNNGNAVITWHQSDGSYTQIFKSEYRNGTWNHPDNLSDNISPDGENAVSPEVAMDNNGTAVITWQQSDSAYTQIFKSEYRDGTWDHPDDLADNISPDENYAYYPQVAMDDSGSAVITWRQPDGYASQIFTSAYRDGDWTHPADLIDNISPAGQNAYSPQVTMDNNGNAIVTWFQTDNSNTAQIYLSEYRNGTWTHPADLSDNISPYGEDALSPRVVMGNNGDAVITWIQSDGTYDRVFMSDYR